MVQHHQADPVLSSNVNQRVLNPANNGMELDDIILQDYSLAGGPHHGELISIQNEMSEAHFELQKVVSDDTASDKDVLKVTSKALSLVEDRMVDLQLSKSLPSHLQRIVDSTLNQITNAKKHIHEVDGFISQY